MSNQDYKCEDIQLLIRATIEFLDNKITFEKLETTIREISNTNIVDIIQSMRQDLRSQLVRELFYFYQRILEKNPAYINLEEIKDKIDPQDLQFLDEKLLPQPQTMRY